MTHSLFDIPTAFHAGQPRGITSVCSAHPIVIEAALRLAKETRRPALIEATCNQVNQVNQDGGYTGMTPAGFRRFVEGIANRVGLAIDRIILGRDHLGPNPCKDLPADQAMEKSEVMIATYAKAGFTKLHLDTSMGCRGEPVALPDETTAARAAPLLWSPRPPSARLTRSTSSAPKCQCRAARRRPWRGPMPCTARRLPPPAWTARFPG